MALEGDIIQGGRVKWSSDNEDNLSDDDFTAIAEDLTDIYDIVDGMNEIEDFEARLVD